MLVTTRRYLMSGDVLKPLFLVKGSCPTWTCCLNGGQENLFIPSSYSLLFHPLCILCHQFWLCYISLPLFNSKPEDLPKILAQLFF